MLKVKQKVFSERAKYYGYSKKSINEVSLYFKTELLLAKHL